MFVYYGSSPGGEAQYGQSQISRSLEQHGPLSHADPEDSAVIGPYYHEANSACPRDMRLVALNTAGNMDPAATQTPPPRGRPRLIGHMNMAAPKPQKNVVTTLRDSLPAPILLNRLALPSSKHCWFKGLWVTWILQPYE